MRFALTALKSMILYSSRILTRLNVENIKVSIWPISNYLYSVKWQLPSRLFAKPMRQINWWVSKNCTGKQTNLRQSKNKLIKLLLKITKIRANALTTSVEQGSKLKTSIKNGSKSKRTSNEIQRRKAQTSLPTVIVRAQTTNWIWILLPIRVCSMR